MARFLRPCARTAHRTLSAKRHSEMSPEAVAAELERLVRREQRDKRLPSIVAAVVRGGELAWETAVGPAGRGAAAGGRSPAARPLVPRGRGDRLPLARRQARGTASRPARLAPAFGLRTRERRPLADEGGA